MTKRAQQQQTRIKMIREQYNADYSVMDEVHIIKYGITVREKFYLGLIIFIGSSSRPAVQTRFTLESDRSNEVTRVITQKRLNDRNKEKIAFDKKNFIPESVAGDIFVYSWGYDQTQVEFFKLLSVKSKTGTFIRIGHNDVPDRIFSDYSYVVPDEQITFGAEIKKRISKHGDTEMFSFENGSCRKWDGKPKYTSTGH